MGEEREAGNGDGEEQQEHEPALCDFCNEARAVLYCRADAARLCLACDRHVHLANTVSSRHPRSLLCNACSSAPSSILLRGRVLCSNCDFDVGRGGGGAQRERRPVEAFSGCPAAADLVGLLGLGEVSLKKNTEEEEEENCDFWGLLQNDGCFVWDTPTVVRLDDLIVPSSDSAAAAAAHAFQSVGVPPPPKDRNLVCGTQREEILQQLRELSKSETHFGGDADAVLGFPPLTVDNNDHQQDNLHPDFGGDATFTTTPNYEGSHELECNNDDWQATASDPATSSFPAMNSAFPVAVADFPATTEFPAGGGDIDPEPHLSSDSLPPRKWPQELLCPDRDSVISRYKEKRKTRRYDKLIRYESRKARADSRVRIKGRFAKANQVPNS